MYESYFTFILIAQGIRQRPFEDTEAQEVPEPRTVWNWPLISGAFTPAAGRKRRHKTETCRNDCVPAGMGSNV